MKKILSFIIITAILMLAVPALSSCDKPTVFNLLEVLFYNEQDGSIYIFDTELNIKVNKEYLHRERILFRAVNPEFDSVPDEINLRLEGALHNVRDSRFPRAVIDVYLDDLHLPVIWRDGILRFANGALSRAVFELLAVTGFIDTAARDVIRRAAFDGADRIFNFDLSEFDLSWFGQYAEQIERTFTVTSKLEIQEDSSRAGIDMPNFGSGQPYISLEELIRRVEEEYTRLSACIYAELYIILNPADNTVNILATTGSGIKELLDPVVSNVNLSAAAERIRDNASSVWTENMFPMRRILELMGLEVGWNYEERKPFMVRSDGIVYFEADIVNSRAYIDLAQFLGTAWLNVEILDIGHYLEFMIWRR